jgi:DNA-binding CsgD family transcriptional regulator
LKIQFPDLTDNDIKLCGLIRLKLTVKQIGIIKNITPESAKIAKNRLSKKLMLSPGSNLYEFLKSF